MAAPPPRSTLRARFGLAHSVCASLGPAASALRQRTRRAPELRFGPACHVAAFTRCAPSTPAKAHAARQQGRCGSAGAAAAPRAAIALRG
jgi:hypothetical protein